MKDLRNKFTVDFLEEGALVSKKGNFSTVMKVRDSNGEVYCGKLPKMLNISCEIFNLPFSDLEEVRSKFNYNKSYFSRVFESFKHEAYIAKEIYDGFEHTVRPEGATEVKVEGFKDFYLPAFVNEFDEEMRGISKDNSCKNFNKESDSILKDLISSGFELNWDSWGRDNFLYSKRRGLKIIDFNMVGFKGKFNPHPMYRPDNRDIVNDIKNNTFYWKKTYHLD